MRRESRLRRWMFAFAAACLAAGVFGGWVVGGTPARAAVSPGVTERVSVANDGTEGPRFSEDPAISADGRYVAFATQSALDPLDAGNDTPPGEGPEFDVYVRDTVAHTTTLISSGQATDNGEVFNFAGDGDSFAPSISATGRYIAFVTEADNIPAGADDTAEHVVICDRDPDNDGTFNQRCTYTAVPHGNGLEFETSPSLSADGGTLSYMDSGQAVLVHLNRDAQGDVPDIPRSAVLTPPVPSTVDGFSHSSDVSLALSADGNRLAVVPDYESTDPTNFQPGFSTVVVWHVDSGALVRVDVDDGLAFLGSPDHFLSAVTISGDGTRIAFEDSPSAGPLEEVRAENLDPASGAPTRSAVVSVDRTGAVVGGQSPALSADGRYLAFATDAVNVHNGVDDPIRTFSCLTGEEEIQSPVAPAADPSAPPATGISFCDIVVRDLTLDQQRAAAGQPLLPAELASPSIRDECLAFTPGQTCEGDGDSTVPVLDADGSAVAYMSAADDLVPGDGNQNSDVFERRFTPTVTVPPVDFGSVQLGDGLTVAVPVAYQGFGPLTITAVGISGPDAGDFTLQPGGTCGTAVLHETDTCLVRVRFTPGALGPRTGELDVTPRGGAPVPGTLTGTGVPAPPPPVPGFAAAPDPLAFGTRPVLAVSAPRTVTVTNTGSAPLAVATVAVVGGTAGFPGDYRITVDTCVTGAVPPGGSCEVTVVHQPRGIGERPALLQFTDNAAPLPQTVGLTGAGAVPVLTVRPPLGPPGSVSQVHGENFPPGLTVRLNLDLMAGGTTPAVADASGAFTVPLVIMPHTEPGPRLLHAVVLDAPTPLAAQTPFLVVPGTAQPPDFAQRR